jgi:UMF1 family MFS transporter
VGLLKRLGLDRPELRAWAMYDWGNSAFITVVITAVYPIYYQRVACAGADAAVGTARHAWTTAIALSLVAVLSPVIGAIADFAAIKKRLLGVALTLGLVSTAALYFVGEGDWLLGSTLFALGNVGVLVSITVYDSLLPHLAKGDELDRVSSAGYALGYVGGGLLLLFDILLIEKHTWFGLADRGIATRVAFVTVAVWWGLFALPVLRRVPEPPRRLEADERGDENPIAVAFGRLGETFRELKGYRQAFLLLLAVLVYNDGITTIYRMATVFGGEIGLPQPALIGAILMVQFVGVPFAFAFGMLAGRIGPKRAILLGLSIYLGISVLGYFVRTPTHFFILAFLVAMVQGGCQALSRSLFASMVPAHKSSEFFGFFGVAERFSAILGPMVFAWVTAATGQSRNAVVAIAAFFLVGGLLLTRVDIEEGRRVAREAARDLHPAGDST